MLKYDKIFQSVLLQAGESKVIQKALEELSELSTALWQSQKIDNDSVLEEVADVKIMIRQLELIFGEVDSQVSRKMKRLEKRIESDDLEKGMLK